jgi:hypothetical protein
LSALLHSDGQAVILDHNLFATRNNEESLAMNEPVTTIDVRFSLMARLKPPSFRAGDESRVARRRQQHRS